MEGQINWTTFMVGGLTLAVILLLKRWPRLPGILIAVVGATVAVGVLDLATRAGVSVLGSLSQGLPGFAIPWITRADIVPALIGGCAVALISFADTSVLSRVYASMRRAPEPGNGRPRHRQPRRRFFPGLPDQQQLVTHVRGRSRRRQNPNDRRRRRTGGCLAAGGGIGPAATSAVQRPSGRRDRLGHWPDRNHRPAPDLSHPALGMLAVDRLYSRRGRVRRDRRHRPGP